MPSPFVAVVVGAGVAGMSAARALRASRPDARVIVLERSRRAGGLVETEVTPEGLVVEHGADCLVTTKPEGVRTLRDLRLDEAVVSGAAKQSFVATDGDGLVPLPQGVFAPSWATAGHILRSPLFSPPAKARILLEPLVPARIEDADESVASFVRRRFGVELLDRAIGPLLGVIHGTPMDRLSLRVALPRLAQLEREHGSVARGLARSRSAASSAGRAPYPPMISFRRGMGTLTDAMARSLDRRVRTGVDVQCIEPRRRGTFRIRTAEGVLEADAVVVAAPAHAAARMLERLDRELASMLGSVRHGRLDAVTLAWPRARVAHPMNGTGFVVAAGTGRTITGCTWTTESWPNRAPEGVALLRCFASAADAADTDLIAAVRRDLVELMGVAGEPLVVKLRRRAAVLPEYEVGCLDRIEAMRLRAAELGAIALAGNAHGGVGIPDCIRSGERAAAAIGSFVPESALEPLQTGVWARVPGTLERAG